MIAFRFHRGGLKESMDTLCLFSSYNDLYEYISFKRDIVFSSILKSYYCYYDNRIGWYDIYLIYYEKDSVLYPIGFCSERYLGGY